MSFFAARGRYQTVLKDKKWWLLQVPCVKWLKLSSLLYLFKIKVIFQARGGEAWGNFMQKRMNT